MKPPENAMKGLELRASFMLATKTEKTGAITSPDMPPPCFASPMQFQKWKDLAAASPPPPRKDFPNEPNYCRDCSPEGQRLMKEQGRCLFPMVRFRTIRDPEGEEELVGYTPKRFLPRTTFGSYGHSVRYVGQGLYKTRWFVGANGSEQNKVVDRKAALLFADRWGIPVEGDPRGPVKH